MSALRLTVLRSTGPHRGSTAALPAGRRLHGTPQRPTEVTMQPQRNTSFVTLITCAALFLFVAAPAAFAATAPTAPNFPSAVPSQAGALTGPDHATEAARAQERYYSSY